MNTYQDIELIPELIEWKELNGDEFSIDSWLSFHNSAELLIAFGTIFYPKFIEKMGMVFFDYDFPDDNQILLEIQKYHQNDKISYQSLCNHQHIWDIIANQENPDKISYIQIKYIAELLKEVWTMKLNNDFPDLTIKCEIFGLDDKDNLMDIIVTFWAE